MRHIDPGHGVGGEKPDLITDSGTLQSPSKAQAGNRAVMAPGIDEKITHGLILDHSWAWFEGSGSTPATQNAATIHRTRGADDGLRSVLGWRFTFELPLPAAEPVVPDEPLRDHIDARSETLWVLFAKPIRAAALIAAIEALVVGPDPNNANGMSQSQSA